MIPWGKLALTENRRCTPRSSCVATATNNQNKIPFEKRCISSLLRYRVTRPAAPGGAQQRSLSQAGESLQPEPAATGGKLQKMGMSNAEGDMILQRTEVPAEAHPSKEGAAAESQV